jgi:hypothetical protein
LLEKIEVLLFSGEQDLICAHTGTERLINRLEWDGQKGFGVSLSEVWAYVRVEIASLTVARLLPCQNATVNNWYLGEVKVGEWTTRGNLTYAKVRFSAFSREINRVAALRR